jgi:putative acetyltransferase
MGYTREDNLGHFSSVVARENDVWLACDSESIVGLMAISDHTIDQIYIAPPSQRGGVGSLLIDHARSLSPSLLELYTHQRNERARRFYERHGFEVVRLGVSPPPESEPDVFYRWRLEPDASGP